jgi:hypothetical protein
MKERIIARVLGKNALAFWKEEYQEIVSLPVESALFAVLNSQKKNEQVKLLEGISLDPMKLMALS